MANIFSMTGALHPKRSAFNISENRKFDCNAGELIPVMFREVYPGDKIQYAFQDLCRLGAMISPSYVGLDCTVDLFFMPSRLLMGTEFDKFFKDHEGKRTEDHKSEYDFSDFISGGEAGLDEDVITLPRWIPTNNKKYSLWDYFGLPVGVSPTPAPIDFPRRMYNAIWNEYYRNENIQDIVSSTNEEILTCNWRRDYFTSALPFQQRGTAPAISISGTVPVNLSGFAPIMGYPSDQPDGTYVALENFGTGVAKPINGRDSVPVGSNTANLFAHIATSSTNSEWYKLQAYLGAGNGSIDVSKSVGFDVNDIRIAFQIQKWMERNARGGVRYTEFLRSHFGVAPRDEVLDRPVHCGRASSPIMVSEVTQTSATDGTTPQGNLAGHGIGAGKGYVGSYYVQEYGYVMAIFSIRPQRASYFQGIPRELLRETRYDFYSPEFANLSEQPVLQEEIFAVADENANRRVFGYQGRFNELRCGRDTVVGGFRDYYLHWSFARNFESAPNLNSSFAKIDSVNDDLNRIFAAQTDPETGEAICNYLVDYASIIKAIRPMPYLSEAGLLDHH